MESKKNSGPLPGPLDYDKPSKPPNRLRFSRLIGLGEHMGLPSDLDHQAVDIIHSVNKPLALHKYHTLDLENMRLC